MSGPVFEGLTDALGVAAAPFTGGLSLIPTAFNVASQITGNQVLGDLGLATGIGVGAADYFGDTSSVDSNLGDVGSVLNTAGQAIGSAESLVPFLGNLVPAADTLAGVSGDVAGIATTDASALGDLGADTTAGALGAPGDITSAGNTSLIVPSDSGDLAAQATAAATGLDAGSVYGATTAGGGISGVTPTAVAAPGGAAGAGGGGASAAGAAGGSTAGSGTQLNSLEQWLKSNAKWLVPTTAGGVGILRQLLTPQGSGITGLNNTAAAENALLNQDNAANATLLQQQEAAIAAKYAALGEPGSTAQLQDIAAAQNLSLGNQFAINSGILSNAGNAYSAIAQAQAQEDQDLSQAISDFGLAAGLGFATSK